MLYNFIFVCIKDWQIHRDLNHIEASVEAPDFSGEKNGEFCFDGCDDSSSVSTWLDLGSPWKHTSGGIFEEVSRRVYLKAENLPWMW